MYYLYFGGLTAINGSQARQPLHYSITIPIKHWPAQDLRRWHFISRETERGQTLFKTVYYIDLSAIYIEVSDTQ